MASKIIALFFAAAIAVPAAAPAQQNQEPVYRAGNGVTLPKVVKEVRPYYTPKMMKDKIDGSVLLECVVSRAGLPTQIEVRRSLEEETDAQAVHALQQWRFEPGTKDGDPVAVRIAVELRFTLK